ncbi:hypothetical protein I3760_01G082100 [Carya illinoinensis]|nr:hypothetical protein I3760_01G082100 [Carya illinoinensis]
MLEHQIFRTRFPTKPSPRYIVHTPAAQLCPFSLERFRFYLQKIFGRSHSQQIPLPSPTGLSELCGDFLLFCFVYFRPNGLQIRDDQTEKIHSGPKKLSFRVSTNDIRFLSCTSVIEMLNLHYFTIFFLIGYTISQFDCWSRELWVNALQYCVFFN